MYLFLNSLFKVIDIFFIIKNYIIIYHKL